MRDDVIRCNRFPLEAVIKIVQVLCDLYNDGRSGKLLKFNAHPLAVKLGNDVSVFFYDFQLIGKTKNLYHMKTIRHDKSSAQTFVKKG